MGEIYGYDISRPAKNAKGSYPVAVLRLPCCYEQNGAAMSLGRTSTFIDIYIKRDMDRGILTEQEAQELVDHFIMKLRLVKFARTPEYNSLFSGDPTLGNRVHRWRFYRRRSNGNKDFIQISPHT